MNETLSLFDILMQQLGNTEDPEEELDLIEAYKFKIYLKHSDAVCWYFYKPEPWCQ